MSDFPRDIDPRPINGKVLVKMTGNSQTTPGGIHIPDTAKEYPMQGTVVEISPGWYEAGLFRSHQVAIGDAVIFNWKVGFDLILDDVAYRIIHENDIQAILRGANYA